MPATVILTAERYVALRTAIVVKAPHYRSSKTKAVLTCPGSASSSVYEELRLGREVKIDNIVKRGDVQPTRCYICHHQQAHLACTKLANADATRHLQPTPGPVAAAGRLISMSKCVGKPSFHQLRGCIGLIGPLLQMQFGRYPPAAVCHAQIFPRSHSPPTIKFNLDGHLYRECSGCHPDCCLRRSYRYTLKATDKPLRCHEGHSLPHM